MSDNEPADYTVQVDLRGTQAKRRRSDMGVIAAGYTLDMQGNNQELQIRSWAAELRMAKAIEFEWEMDTWYTMKLSVAIEGLMRTSRRRLGTTCRPSTRTPTTNRTCPRTCPPSPRRTSCSP